MFFIRMRLPAGELAQGFTWSLFVVKISAHVSAYMAFRTPGLAELVVEDCNRTTPAEAGAEYSLSIVEGSELDERHYAPLDSKPIVLFETSAQVDVILARRSTYPYEEHLYRYSQATGLSKVDPSELLVAGGVTAKPKAWWQVWRR